MKKTAPLATLRLGLMAGLLSACMGQAWAHPFGSEAVAHHLDVEMRPHEVVARWKIDVPTSVILLDRRSSRQASFSRVLRGFHSLPWKK